MAPEHCARELMNCIYLLFSYYSACRLVLGADGADTLGQRGVAVAEPHHQRVRREVAQAVARQLLEAADQCFTVTMAGGEGVGAILGAARDGVAQGIEQDVDGRQ